MDYLQRNDMGKKMVVTIIDVCFNCPNCLLYAVFCVKKKKYIDRRKASEAIPDWCPLEDVKDD